MNMTEEMMTDLMTMLENQAKALADDAGYGGRMDDGGSGLLRLQMKFFEYGFDRQIPTEWEDLVGDIQNQNDPEWEEYQRLKARFES